MIEPTDLRLFQLQAAEFLGLFVTNAVNTINGFSAVFHGSRFEFFKTVGGRGDGLIDCLKDSPVSAL